MTTPPNSPFAIDWFDGVDWHNEVYCPTLRDALIIAANELRNAINRCPRSRHTLRIQGPETYIIMDSDPEKIQ